MGQLDEALKQTKLLEDAVKLLRRIERAIYFSVPRAKTIELKMVKINKNTGEETTEGEDMNLLLTQDASITVTKITDAAGNVAAVEGDLAWSVSGDQDLGELQVAADKKSAKFVRNGKVGTCTVEVRGDADLSEAVEEIVGTVELVCLGGKAEKFEISALAVDKVVA